MKPSELKTWQSITLGILVGAVAIAAIILISLPDRMTPLVILPTSSPPLMQIYITGAVKSPGVVFLSPDKRIQDALLAAGGANDNADLDQLNLAAVLNDGQKIHVPINGENNALAVSTTITNQSTEQLLVKLNSASQKDLEQLPGIGEEKAAAIIAAREKQGRFQSIDEIQEVPGISKNLFNQIRPFLILD